MIPASHRGPFLNQGRGMPRPKGTTCGFLDKKRAGVAELADALDLGSSGS